MGRGMGANQMTYASGSNGGRGTSKSSYAGHNRAVYYGSGYQANRSTHSDRTKASQGYGQPGSQMAGQNPNWNPLGAGSARMDGKLPSTYVPITQKELDVFYTENPTMKPGSSGNWLRDTVRDNSVRDYLGSAPGVIGTALENTYDYVTGVPAAEVAMSVLGGTLFNDAAGQFDRLAAQPQRLVEWWGSSENLMNPANLSNIGNGMSMADQRSALEAFASQMPDGDSLLRDIDAIQSGTYSGGSSYKPAGMGDGSGKGGTLRNPNFDASGRVTGVSTPSGGTVNVTRKSLKPGDKGYVDYGDPRNMSQTDQFRRFNQLKGMGEDINMSDEEWENASASERQANLEDRQAFRELHGEDLNILQSYMRAYNPESYKDDPQYAEGSIAGYNLDSLSPFDDDYGSPERLADVETKFLNGEISETQLNRYLDDVERSTGDTFNVPLGESLEMLESAGFTDRELQEFSVDYTTIDPNTGDYRSDEEYFDYFTSVVTQLEFEDPELEVEAYDMYDTRRAEDYANAFDYLDAVAGSDSFSETFATMDAVKRNAYLDYLKDEGRLEESVYREMVAQNLATDDEKFFYLPDGSIATNASGSPYETYRVVQFDELDTEYDSPSSIEGFTDEQNERRATVAMLDAGNVSFSDVQPGMKKPKKKKWYDDPWETIKNVGESVAFGGLKELGPAVENVVKGEATSGDYLRVVPFVFEMAEVITPGVNKEEAQKLGDIAKSDALKAGAATADAVQAGSDAYKAARMGKGFVFGDLYTMGYNESRAAITATINGDLKEFAQQRVVSVAFEKGMDALGDTDLIKNMSPKVREATHRTLVEVANGKSLEESLRDQAEEEGEEIIRDWAKKHDWGQYEDKLKQMGRDFDDAVLQPLKDQIPVDGDSARAFLSDFDDDVVQKFTKPIGDLGSDIDDNIIQPTRDFVEDNVIDPIDDAIDSVGDVVDDVVDTVGDALPDFPDGPDLPDLPDLPDFPDIPDFSKFLGALGSLSGLSGSIGGNRAPEEDDDELMEFLDPYDFSGDSIFRDVAQEKRFGITRDNDTLRDIDSNLSVNTNLKDLDLG